MMKKIFSVALVAMSLVSMPIIAQTTNTQQSCEQKAVCKEGKNNKNDESRVTKISKREAAMFEGMNLTDAQKQQIKELKANTLKQRKEKAEAMKAERKQQKAEAKEARKAMKEQAEAEKRAYLKELKKIIGNDNYVIFLENQFVMQSNPQGAKSKMRPMDKKGSQMNKGQRPSKKGEMSKDRKNGQKGMKGQKQDKNQAAVKTA